MEDIALSILTLAESAHFFSAFNPSIFTIKRFPDQQTLKDIIIGCITASTFGIALSIATSLVSKSKYPFLFGLIGIIAMNVIYIYTAYTTLQNNS